MHRILFDLLIFFFFFHYNRIVPIVCDLADHWKCLRSYFCQYQGYRVVPKKKAYFARLN